MPELPEVETVRRGLEPVMAGRKIAGVDVRRPDLRFPFPDRFTQRLEGQRVTHLSRRGKYLLAALDGGETLVMHLGMSGRFTIAAARGGKRRLAEFTYEHGHDAVHDHVLFRMSGGATVTYNDARRFGYMLLIETDALEAHPLFRGMGVEPLGNGLDAAYLAARADGKRTDLKAFLMDQRIVAGLGNIYVCEALFRAGLRPTAPVRRLADRVGRPAPAADRLVAAIRSVLRDALGAGGSTFRDYRRADGSSGAFQDRFAVYGREGEPCLRPGCRGIVRRKVQGGRSTFFCPSCQK